MITHMYTFTCTHTNAWHTHIPHTNTPAPHRESGPWGTLENVISLYASPICTTWKCLVSQWEEKQLWIARQWEEGGNSSQHWWWLRGLKVIFTSLATTLLTGPVLQTKASGCSRPHGFLGVSKPCLLPTTLPGWDPVRWNFFQIKFLIKVGFLVLGALNIDLCIRFWFKVGNGWQTRGMVTQTLRKLCFGVGHKIFS